MKTCKVCNFEKELENYYINKRNKDNYDNVCKVCTKEKNKKNRDKNREAQIRWREKNPDYMKNYGKSEKVIEYGKKYYKDHKQEYIKRKQEWRILNPEKAKQERINYIENNKEKVNLYHSKWKKEKRINDPLYKLKENTSRRIRYELNTLLKGKKSKSTVEYLGCTIDELKIYLQEKFKDSMTWENYGKIWQIDHIIPCNSWNLIDNFENNCCWNFRNLQPLNSTENKSKKDKYNEDDKKVYINLMKTILI